MFNLLLSKLLQELKCLYTDASQQKFVLYGSNSHQSQINSNYINLYQEKFSILLYNVKRD